MPGGRGGGNDRGICALLEYRKRKEAPVSRRLQVTRRALPASMIAASVITMRPRVVARSNDDHRARGGVVAIVVRVRVSMVIRPADDHLTGEVRVSKTQ